MWLVDAIFKMLFIMTDIVLIVGRSEDKTDDQREILIGETAWVLDFIEKPPPVQKN